MFTPKTSPLFVRFVQILSVLAIFAMVFAQVGNVAAQSSNPPTEVEVTVQKKGESVTVKVLKGFDPNEYGGNDSLCSYTGSEPEMIHIGEVVGSANEECLQVIEWSLKQGDRTVVAGTYALAPHEWFYIPMAVAGVNDEVRVVGTLYRMPKGWNSHMMAVYYGIDRDARDGTHSYIGLSPTDPWVLSQVDGLSGRADNAAVAAATNTPVPTVVEPTVTLAPVEPTVTLAPVEPSPTPIPVASPTPTAVCDPAEKPEAPDGYQAVFNTAECRWDVLWVGQVVLGDEAQADSPLPGWVWWLIGGMGLLLLVAIVVIIVVSRRN